MTPELEAAFEREFDIAVDAIVPGFDSPSTRDIKPIARLMFQSGIIIGMRDALGTLKEGDADG